MQSAAHEPLYDIDPRTGVTIEVFYADRRWRHSAGAALVGFGGLADVDVHQMARLWGRSLRVTQRIGTR